MNVVRACSSAWLTACFLIATLNGCARSQAPTDDAAAPKPSVALGDSTVKPALAATSASESTNSGSAAREPAAEKKMSGSLKKATFGAGCFWGVEEAFRHVDGVTSTAVGYMGGKTDRPTYKEVCTDRSGHAEVVQLEYDPSKVTYETLLDTFWKVHNPTTLNRQGPDIGTQYRSAIYFHDAEQESLAKASKEKLGASGKYNRPIVTEITPAAEFWIAEDYHQQYLAKRGITHCPSTGAP